MFVEFIVSVGIFYCLHICLPYFHQ